MRKSISGFIFGLIGSLFSLWWGFVFSIMGDAAGAIIAIGTGDPSATFLIQILGWLCFIGAIVGIIGSSLCLKKAKKGGITLIFATILCGALLIYVFINAIKAGGTMVPTLILVLLLPVILLGVADVCALISKETGTPVNGVNGYVNSQYVNPQPVSSPAKKTLEQELTELKTMLDKSLLTEEEYTQAKKNVLEKFTK